MLKLALLLLMLFGLGFGSWGDACPDKVKLPANVNSCEQVCREIEKELPGFQVKSAIGADKLKNRDGVAFIKAYCGCVYEMPSDLAIPLKLLSCEYQVSFSASGGGALRLNVDVEIPEDTPTKLVKVFSFQASDPGLSGGASIVFSGLYAAYVNAIKGIVAGSALMVVMVVSGFFVLATISERTFDFLRDRIRVLSKDTGTEIARKFAYTTLAIIFFSLPVPSGSPALKLTSAREGDSKKIAEECRKSFERLDRMGEQDEKKSVESSENEAYRREAIRACGEIENRIQDGRVYLPLAVGVVSSLINTGTGFAKWVNGITESVVVAYMHYKIASAYKNLEMLYNNPETENIKESIREEAASKSSPVETGGCLKGSGSDVCSLFTGMTQEERNKIKAANPHCGEVHRMLEQTCGAGNLGVSTGIAKSIQSFGEGQEEVTGRSDAFNAVMNSMDGLRRGLSWMSSASLPLSMFLFQTALLIPPDKPSEEAMATLVRQESSWANIPSKVIEEAERALTDAVESAERVLGVVSWGDLLHGQNRTQIAFNLGYIMGFVSVPPGSIFQGKLEKILSAAGQTATGVFNRIVSLPVVSRAIDLLSKVFVAGAADVVATMIAFVLAHGVVDTIPLLAVAIPLIFKFWGFLLDIAKFVISLPFYGALAATKRFEGEALSFFPIAVKLMLTPPVFAIAPLFGFAVVELTLFFLYKVPMFIIAQSLGALTVDSVIVAFILGHAVAIMYIAANIAAAIAGWEAAKGFVDGVFEVLNRVLGFISSSANREIVSALTVLRTRMAMG